MSKKITVEKALQLLREAHIVRVFSNDWYYDAIINESDITGDPENEFLLISWQDEDGYEFDAKLAEGQNPEVKAKSHALTFVDTEGDEIELLLFKIIPLEA